MVRIHRNRNKSAKIRDKIEMTTQINKKKLKQIERIKDTVEFKKDMNRNILLGLACGFSAATFASTSDALDFDNDGESVIGFRGLTSIVTISMIFILFVINPLIHLYDMYRYTKLTHISVSWWYLYPIFLIFIGIIPVTIYIILLLID